MNESSYTTGQLYDNLLFKKSDSIKSSILTQAQMQGGEFVKVPLLGTFVSSKDGIDNILQHSIPEIEPLYSVDIDKYVSYEPTFIGDASSFVTMLKKTIETGRSIDIIPLIDLYTWETVNAITGLRTPLSFNQITTFEEYYNLYHPLAKKIRNITAPAITDILNNWDEKISESYRSPSITNEHTLLDYSRKHNIPVDVFVNLVKQLYFDLIAPLKTSLLRATAIFIDDALWDKEPFSIQEVSDFIIKVISPVPVDKRIVTENIPANPNLLNAGDCVTLALKNANTMALGNLDVIPYTFQTTETSHIAISIYELVMSTYIEELYKYMKNEYKLDIKKRVANKHVHGGSYSKLILQEKN